MILVYKIIDHFEVIGFFNKNFAGCFDLGD